MKTQKEIFLAGEGDNWYSRNKEHYQKTKDKNDLIIQTLQDIELRPKKVLEIGCSNGMRLNKLKETFGSDCYGLDPSSNAIENGKREFPGISLQAGSADTLPFEDNSFDMIIFGFCLYLCDRKDLFKIAWEADRCLADHGFIVKLDFCPPFPYKNKYVHEEGIHSYKMDYAKMFTWNPAYQEIYKTVFSHNGKYSWNDPNEKTAISILHKNMAAAYPSSPY